MYTRMNKRKFGKRKRGCFNLCNMNLRIDQYSQSRFRYHTFEQRVYCPVFTLEERCTIISKGENFIRNVEDERTLCIKERQNYAFGIIIWKDVCLCPLSYVLDLSTVKHKKAVMMTIVEYSINLQALKLFERNIEEYIGVIEKIYVRLIIV